MSKSAKPAVLASLIFSSALFAAMFSKRTSASPPPWSPPDGSQLPPMGPPFPPGGVPAPPWALPAPVPTPPSMVAIKAGRRYEAVVDVQAADGVGLRSAATKIIDALKLDDPSLKGYKNVERPGVGEVTRVTLRVTSLIDNSFPLETRLQTPGVGSVWLVSVKDVTQ